MIDFVVWEDELSVDRNGEILDCVAENSADRFSLCGKTNSPNFVPPTHSKTANEWGTRHPAPGDFRNNFNSLENRERMVNLEPVQPWSRYNAGHP